MAGRRATPKTAAPPVEEETLVEEPQAPERRHPVPEGYEDQPASWYNAYDHAMDMKWTSQKGAILFADAHMHDPEFGASSETEEELTAQINMLQDKRDSVRGRRR